MTAAAPTAPTVASLQASPKADAVKYKFMVRPFGLPNAIPIIVESPTPDANIPGLIPGAKYEATVVAFGANGELSPDGNKVTFSQPAAGAPVLTQAESVGPTSGQVAVSPPATGGPWASYTFTAIPRGGGSPVSVLCANPQCSISGMKPAAIYDITATLKSQAGTTSAASNSLPLVTPPAE